MHGLLLKTGTKAAMKIDPSLVRAVTTCFVEYKEHTGQYTARSRILFPAQLPRNTKRGSGTESRVGMTWWPAVLIRLDKDFEAGNNPWKSVDDDANEWMEEETTDLNSEVGTEVSTATGSSACTAGTTSTVQTVWLSCQEMLRWEPPAAWSFPLRRTLV